MKINDECIGHKVVGFGSNGVAPLLAPDEHDLVCMAVIRQAYDILIAQMNSGKVFTENPIRRGDTLYFKVGTCFFAVGPVLMGHYNETEIPLEGEPQGEMTIAGIGDIYSYSLSLARELNIAHPDETA